MALPSIAVINFSNVSDPDVQHALRAVNRQIQEDFMPIWGQGRELQLQASRVDPTAPSVNLEEELVSADSVLYLVTESTLPGALGYHDMNTSEVPVGFVFTALGDWTITLSHEALELIVDPTVNIFVPGPDPRPGAAPDSWLWHTYEVCDAVERMSYQIDGVAVSDFVTPTYFRPGNSPGTRNDFLGVGVPSFGLMPGCHLGVVDPLTLEFEFILAREAAGTRTQAARRAAYDHPKPARPDDDQLAKILLGVKEQVRKLPSFRPNSGLDLLNGITRTSRYRTRAEALKAAKR
jgi:hypothetical protein